LDRDERRRKIAEVVVHLIAREGLEAATVRRVAAEVGFSTTIVTHYFAGKQEMLLWTYRALGEIGLGRFESAEIHSAADLVEVLMGMTAADDGTRALWRTYIAIWDTALRDPALAAELRSWDEIVGARLARHARELNPQCVEPQRVAKRLLALVQGISVQRLFNPESWSLAEARDAYAGEIERFVGRGGAAQPASAGVAPAESP
jgi:AcrR family transcriptional regulator